LWFRFGSLGSEDEFHQKGIKVSKAAMKCLDITGDQFHPVPSLGW
jgi:hypothetical protein